jgi:subfamily B ATP-binding cassette protein MsbA
MRIYRLIKPYKGWVALNVFSNIMVALFTVISIPALIPFLRLLFGMEEEVQVVTEFQFAHALDYLIYQLWLLIETYGRDQVMIWLCILLTVVFLMKNIFRYISQVALAPMRNAVVRDLRVKLFEKLIHLHTAYFSDEKKGNLIARFSTDTAEVEGSILNILEIFFRAPFILAGSLAYMLYVSPQLTLYVLLLVIIVTFIISRISIALKSQAAAAQAQAGWLLSLVEEGIGGQKVYKAYTAEKVVIRQFTAVSNRLRQMMNKILWRRDLASPLSEFFGVSVLVFLLWLGSRMVYYEGVDPAYFLTFLFAFYNVIDPAKQFANGVFNVRKGIAALDRIEDVLNTENQIKESPDAIEYKEFSTSIEFEQVHFAYPESDRPVLTNLSFSIPKGKKVALVGPSGSGKSTMLDLVQRFRDVQSGRITIDGIDIRTIKLQSLRQLFGLVTQDPFLFNDTIYNNIVFGNENVTKEAVIEAAKKAHAHDFIMETDLGYDSIVGDSGVKLSGGQKQRITIARAIIKDPPIFLLDEATSALDSASEKLVQKALDTAMKNRTSVIIAHRLSTIQNADLILVLKDGRIIESGTHTELMSQNSTYKEYIELQLI